MINRSVFVLRKLTQKIVFIVLYFIFVLVILFPPLWVLSFPYWLLCGRDMMDDIFYWFDKNVNNVN